MIKTVIRCASGMVLVFDENGEQLPGYQGNYDDVRERIFRDISPDTVFNHSGDGVSGLESVPGNSW